MSSNQESMVFSGKNAKIYVNGEVFGYAQGVSWNEDYGVQDVTAIGSFKVLEHQKTIFRVSGSIQKWVIRANKVKAFKDVASDDVLGAGTITLECYDEVTGDPIRILEGVTFAGRGGGINAGALMSETIQFRAIEARNA